MRQRRAIAKTFSTMSGTMSLLMSQDSQHMNEDAAATTDLLSTIVEVVMEIDGGLSRSFVLTL